MEGRKLPYRKTTGYDKYNPTFKAKAKRLLKKWLRKLDRQLLVDELKKDVNENT